MIALIKDPQGKNVFKKVKMVGSTNSSSNFPQAKTIDENEVAALKEKVITMENELKCRDTENSAKY